MKAYDGMMHLLDVENWLILKSAKGAPIAVMMGPSDRKGDCYRMGSKIKFPLHSVRVGKCLSSPVQSVIIPNGDVPSITHANHASYVDHTEPSMSLDYVVISSEGGNLEFVSVERVSVPVFEFSSAVYDSMMMGLDFSAAWILPSISGRTSSLQCTRPMIRVISQWLSLLDVQNLG
jgi:hypothetical protein